MSVMFMVPFTIDHHFLPMVFEINTFRFLYFLEVLEVFGFATKVISSGAVCSSVTIMNAMFVIGQPATRAS
mgnify:CR=1 FL=1